MKKALEIEILAGEVKVNVSTLGVYVSSYDTDPASVPAQKLNDVFSQFNIDKSVDFITPEKAFREAVQKTVSRHGAIQHRGYKAVAVEKSVSKENPMFGLVFTYRNSAGQDAEGVQEFVVRLEGDKLAFYANVDGDGVPAFNTPVAFKVAQDIREEFERKYNNLLDSSRIALVINAAIVKEFEGVNVRRGATFFILPPHQTERFKQFATGVNEAFFVGGKAPKGVRVVAHHIAPEDRKGDAAQELGMVLTEEAVELQDEIEAYLKEWRQTPEGRKKTMGATMAERFESRIEEAVARAQEYRKHYEFSVSVLKDALTNAMDLTEILAEEVADAGIVKK